MRRLDLTLPTPAENLACDEALLDWALRAAGSDAVHRRMLVDNPAELYGLAAVAG